LKVINQRLKGGFMSETEEKVIGGQVEVQEEKAVDYETYKRVVATEKKARKERREALEEIESLKEKLASIESKKVEDTETKVIETLRGDIRGMQEKLKERDSKIAKTLLKSEFRNIASSLGCTNPDKLMRLVDKNDVGSVEVDLENLNVNKQDLEHVILKAKEENPEFFKAQEKKLPKSGNASFDISTISTEDKLKFLVSNK